MSDLRAMLGDHTGVRVFEGRVYCHPCGELLYDPLEGFFGGPLIQRGGETIGEAAHASHLNVLLSDLLAQAWEEGHRASERDWEMALRDRGQRPPDEDHLPWVNPYQQEAVLPDLLDQLARIDAILARSDHVCEPSSCDWKRDIRDIREVRGL